mgnify:CR=1 FL=1
MVCRSTPWSSRWVANECLRLCAEYMPFSKPASAMALRTMTCMAPLPMGLPVLLPSNRKFFGSGLQVIASQVREQAFGQYGDAVLVALAFDDLDFQFLRVDTTDLQVHHFIQAQSGTIEHAQDAFVLQV